jgi:hypothetical protein
MIDELQQMVQHLSEKVDGWRDGLKTRVNIIEQCSKERFIALEMACAEADVEHEDLDKHFSYLKQEVTRLNRLMERATMAHPHAKYGILSTNESVSARSAATVAAVSPEGHRSDLHAWDHEFGMVFTQTHISANGTPYPKSTSRGVENAIESSGSVPHPSHYNLVRSSHDKLTKINFPMFTSEDPQLWHARCVNYFDMYDVEWSLWVRVASMHVEGPATHWLQSVEWYLHIAGWDEFCALIHECFSRDKHESLIHQLFHIR